MREIKFRAWDKKEKKMEYDIQDLCCEHDRDGLHLYLAHPEENEVMQYTGLKDKNGKEIYEGDIVKSKKFECAEVKSSGSGAWIFNGQWTAGHFVIADRKLDMEIIGNIHENPEMLK